MNSAARSSASEASSRVPTNAGNTCGTSATMSRITSTPASRVARHPNRADGRSSLVSLTASGAVLAAEAENTFRERLTELTSPALAASDVEAIAPVLAAVRAALERDRVGLPVG